MLWQSSPVSVLVVEGLPTRVFLFLRRVCVFIGACPMCPITGCNARAVRQADATPNRWEDTVDRFWQYVSELNQKADGVVQNLKASQLSRELE